MRRRREGTAREAGWKWDAASTSSWHVLNSASFHPLHHFQRALANELDDVEQEVADYNSRAEELALIPAETKLAGGVDFEIRSNRLASKPGQPLLTISSETLFIRFIPIKITSL